MYAKFVALASLALAGGVSAWGSEGHSGVGFVADALIQANTRAVRDYLLPAGWNFNRSSTWADEIKDGKSGNYKWAAALHYVDAEDVTPLDVNSTTPLDCKVEFPRDQAGGINIIDAIGNYTTRLQTGKNTLDWNQKSEAVKFLSHFIGDITQPLHNCGKLVGGNSFKVVWEGQSTYMYNGYNSTFQLHVIWDIYMPEKDINENFGGSLDAWHQWILNATLPGGEFHKEAEESWYNSDEPLAWANDANSMNCGKVWDAALLKGTNPNVVFTPTSTTNDLAGDYYQALYMDIRKQIAKGGYRLAKYMDMVLKDQPIPSSSTTVAPVSTTTAAAPISTTTAAAPISTTTAAAPISTTTTAAPISTSAAPVESSTPCTDEVSASATSTPAAAPAQSTPCTEESASATATAAPVESTPCTEEESATKSAPAPAQSTPCDEEKTPVKTAAPVAAPSSTPCDEEESASSSPASEPTDVPVYSGAARNSVGAVAVAAAAAVLLM
ncbi:hypothetical protein HKX48_002477 [Thoreauomyces humboldtii]|nr:hypothetical protein HKX48_002477 [Thoreauomyces humboldtii]